MNNDHQATEKMTRLGFEPRTYGLKVRTVTLGGIWEPSGWPSFRGFSMRGLCEETGRIQRFGNTTSNTRDAEQLIPDHLGDGLQFLRPYALEAYERPRNHFCTNALTATPA